MGRSASETTRSHPSWGLASAGTSHQETSPYQHQPLPGEGYIRRLILEPASSSRDPLTGRLEIIELNDAPRRHPFEAISYTWGPKNKDEIMIDGRPLAINAGSSEALRQVRKPDRRRALWIDEICIQQNDAEEKGHQVFHMGEVYKASGCTLICLGAGRAPQDQRHASEAAKLIDSVNEMMVREFETSSWGWNSFPFPRADDPLIDPDRWESWNRLVRCEWFRRGWVWQEAALGPDGCVFWAGVEISWNRVIRANCWLARRALVPGGLNIAQVLVRRYVVHQREEAVTFYFEYEAARLSAMPTLRMLGDARWTSLTEPKDRIYAFLALPTSDDAMSDLGIKPDYRETTSHPDVYRDFATRYLAKTRDLNLLCFVEHDDAESISDLQLPSWVPRWDHGADVSRPVLGSTARHSENIILDITDDGSALWVRAIILDSVQYVSKNEFQIEHPDPVTQVEQLWREFRPQSASYPGPHQSRLSLAFLQATCRGRYEGEWGTWLRAQKAFAQLLQPDQPMDIEITHSEEAPHGAQQISSFAVEKSGGRRFVLLSRGYFSVAPRVTRKGDVCAIISGAELPLILRKLAGSENRYRVLGAAYVQSSECNKDGVPLSLAQDKNVHRQDWLKWDPPPAEQDILLY